MGPDRSARHRSRPDIWHAAGRDRSGNGARPKKNVAPAVAAAVLGLIQRIEQWRIKRAQHSSLPQISMLPPRPTGPLAETLYGPPSGSRLSGLDPFRLPRSRHSTVRDRKEAIAAERSMRSRRYGRPWTGVHSSQDALERNLAAVTDHIQGSRIRRSSIPIRRLRTSAQALRF